VALWSKAYMVLDHLHTGIMELNSAPGMVHTFCIMLSCVDRDLMMDWSPNQGVLPVCLNVVIVSEINSESEQAEGLICQMNISII
jgi:hypothetical protein